MQTRWLYPEIGQVCGAVTASDITVQTSLSSSLSFFFLSFFLNCSHNFVQPSWIPSRRACPNMCVLSICRTHCVETTKTHKGQSPPREIEEAAGCSQEEAEVPVWSSNSIWDFLHLFFFWTAELWGLRPSSIVTFRNRQSDERGQVCAAIKPPQPGVWGWEKRQGFTVFFKLTLFDLTTESNSPSSFKEKLTERAHC